MLVDALKNRTCSSSATVALVLLTTAEFPFDKLICRGDARLMQADRCCDFGEQLGLVDVQLNEQSAFDGASAQHPLTAP